MTREQIIREIDSFLESAKMWRDADSAMMNAFQISIFDGNFGEIYGHYEDLIYALIEDARNASTPYPDEIWEIFGEIIYDISSEGKAVISLPDRENITLASGEGIYDFFTNSGLVMSLLAPSPEEL